MNEPALGDHHSGDAESAEQLNPHADDTRLTRHGLVGTKPCQGLPADHGKDPRHRRALNEWPRLLASAKDTPGADAEEQERSCEERRGDV